MRMFFKPLPALVLVGICCTLTFLIGTMVSDNSHDMSVLQTKIDRMQNIINSQEARLEKLKNLASEGSKSQNPTKLYLITPTYARPVQKAELTRMANTFVNVPQIHWIIVEDSAEKTDLVKDFIFSYQERKNPRGGIMGITITHLNIPTPEAMKLKPKDPNWSKPRGVYQRNVGLDWLIANCEKEEGVIYFADDDNSYSLELFDVIQDTKKVSVFPVGLVGGVYVERPQVKDGKVVGWEVGWGPSRPFATDMAGFAVNLQFYMKSKGKFSDRVKIGHLETDFLKNMATLSDLEPKSLNKVLVWHTRTEKPLLNMETRFRKKFGRESRTGVVL